MLTYVKFGYVNDYVSSGCLEYFKMQIIRKALGSTLKRSFKITFSEKYSYQFAQIRITLVMLY